MYKTILCILLIALLLPVYCVKGDKWSEQYSRASLFFLFNNWKETAGDFENELGEGVFGLRVNHIVNPQLTVDLWGTFTNARYSDSNSEDNIDISALNDTRLKGTYYFGERIASVSLSANLPTGKKKLSDDQYLVALGVSDNSRKYSIRRFGQGFDLGGEFLFLPKHENVEFQIGGGYLHKGSYQVLEDDEVKYKFGDEFYGKAGIDLRSRPVSFRGSVTFKSYSKDQYDSDDVYQAGNTLLIAARLSYVEHLRGNVGLLLLARSKAKIKDGDNSLSEESLKSGRNELLFYASGSIPLKEPLRLIGRGEYKNVSANDYDESSTQYRPKTSYIGFGGGFSYQFSLTTAGNIVATYYTGTVDDDNDLSGVGLTAVLTFRYW